jgi:hypothetical protein
LQYAREWQEANKLFPNRILVVQYEEICSNPKEETQRVFDFLGLAFKAEYLDFPTPPDIYVNRGGVRKNYIFEYREGLSEQAQNRLLWNTRQFSEWHWQE